MLYGTCHLMRREGVSGKLIAKLQGIARDADTRRPYKVNQRLNNLGGLLKE